MRLRTRRYIINLNLAYSFCIIAFIGLMVYKALYEPTLSWWVVTSPLYAPILVILVPFVLFFGLILALAGFSLFVLAIMGVIYWNCREVYRIFQRGGDFDSTIGFPMSLVVGSMIGLITTGLVVLSFFGIDILTFENYLKWFALQCGVCVVLFIIRNCFPE